MSSYFKSWSKEKPSEQQSESSYTSSESAYDEQGWNHEIDEHAVGEQPPLPRNLVQPPGAVENMLGTAPVPFRLRSIEDSERVYRLRQTSFIGRSHRQMREEDLRGG